MSNNLLTIIVLTYNQNEFIEEALTSILNQNRSDFELVISDDCSSDGTVELINEILSNYKGDIPYRVNFNKRNLGLMTHLDWVLNNLIETEYIAFNPGDDISFPSRVDKLYTYIENYSPDFLLANSIRIDVKGQVLGLFYRKHATKRIYLRDLFSGAIQPMGATCLYKMERIRQVTLKDYNINNEDYIFPRISLLGGAGIFVGEPLTYYRVHSKSLTLKRDANRELLVSENRLKNYKIIRDVLGDNLPRIESIALKIKVRLEGLKISKKKYSRYKYMELRIVLLMSAIMVKILLNICSKQYARRLD